MKKLIVILLSTLLIGCSTGYQKYGLNGGYKDMKISNNSYLIEYYSSATTDIATNMKHALRRAAEITKSNGYKYFEITENANLSVSQNMPLVANTYGSASSSTIGSYSGSTTGPFYGGSYGSTGYASGNSTTLISGGNTIVAPGIALRIKLSNKQSKNSYNAKIILDNYLNEK